MSDKYAALSEKCELIISQMNASHKDVAIYAPVMTWDEFEQLLAERDADKRLIAEYSRALNNLAAVARRYLPDYDEHPDIQVADNLLEKNELISEMEARTLTVKLPDCDLGAVQHMSGGSDDYCNGFVDGTQNAIKTLTKDCAAAGISLKIEGE